MLFIKFKIHDSEKYIDFKKLYTHMVAIRQPNFEFEEEEPLDFDWDNMTEKEIEEAVNKLSEIGDDDIQATKRYEMLIPDYANNIIESFTKLDQDKAGSFGFDKMGIFNYLEYSFEVDFDKLESLNKTNGIVEFSTGNYPFGGMERFLITLKAFDLEPTEYFDGFSIFELNWETDYKYNSIELPEKTKLYLNQFKS